VTNASSPPGWYQDPTGQSDGRYWNGTAWTQVSMQGGRTVDLPIDPSMAQVQPVPGTEVQPPTPPQATTSSSGGSGRSGGAIIAIVVGLLLLLAVFVAVDDNAGNTPTPEGTVPAETPTDTQAPAPDE
jgi:hypothetical protein